ncbi:MAG TPA: helix-turn-helix transcriptional regulator [Candidatus Onthoplasma faecigallinarum]|nr:helix-turn-helix transcriptional regulator [Candidatus Onthoplasma faecigallinarum]
MNDVLLKDVIRKRLIEEIDASGLSYAEICRKVGINPSSITQYKNSTKLPTIETLAKICEIIGADANYILGLTD